MKTLITTTAIALCATTNLAQAGGLAPLVEEPQEIMMVAPDSSVGDWIVPVIFLALVAAAASGSSSDSTTGSETAGISEFGSEYTDGGEGLTDLLIAQ